jgi:hypothetical protein
MIDDNISKILKNIKTDIKIKIIAKTLCYLTLLLSTFFFIFFIFFTESKNIKLIKDIKNNQKNYSMEKVMINPKMNFQKEKNEIYLIKAKKAEHKSKEEIILYDVISDGKLGKISSGKLEIKKNGDHLIFSDKPMLILNKTETND